MKTAISLAQLFLTVSNVSGKKKLQKLVHILQSCTNANFGVKFSLSHYGAFSSSLASNVDMLSESGFLEFEIKESPYPCYVFQGNSQRLRKILGEDFDPDKLEWATLAHELNKKNTPFLEALSTVIYLIQNGWSSDDLRDQFNGLKPHLADQFESAFSRAKELLSVCANED